MTGETPEDTGKKAARKTAQAESERTREVRQAAALRENLLKRNAQRRERKSEAPDSGPDVDSE